MTNMEDVDQPKFTVQQIILLQKLVQSGLSKEQIIAGVDEMEKCGGSTSSRQVLTTIHKNHVAHFCANVFTALV